MPASLFVDRLNLEELFASIYLFALPWFQRSYAWSDEHARCLLEDIRAAVTAGNGWYLLGPIILTRRPGKTAISIIDGQQRLITISILLAILRDLIDDEPLAAALHERLWQSGPEPRRRIDPKEFIGETLLKFVQEKEATKRNPQDIESNRFNDGESNIIENRNAMRKMLHGVSQEELQELARFVLKQCYLVVQTVEEEQIAIHLFVKAQDSGLRLAPTDMLKVSVLTHVEREARDECALIWDGATAYLGAAGLTALLRHLCNIKRRSGAVGPVEIELFKFYDIADNAAGFINDTLYPMAAHAVTIANWSMGQSLEVGGEQDGYDAINRRLQYLSWITHTEWKAPALLWLSTNGDDPKATFDFLVRLERFAFIHMLIHTQIPGRMGRYAKVIAGIEDGTVLDDDGPLQLSKVQISNALKQLRRKRFFLKYYRAQVFLRANGAAEGDERVRKVPMVSVEHVFPKNPRVNAQWLRVFDDAGKAARYVHRLGNLTPLTLQENCQAGAQELSVKREIYATSPFKLTNHTASYANWNYDTINARTSLIIDLLLKSWKLK